MGLTARIRTRDGWAVSHAVVTVTDMTGAQVLRAEADDEGAVRDATELAPGAVHGDRHGRRIRARRRPRAGHRERAGRGRDRDTGPAGRHRAAAARALDHRPRALRGRRGRPAPGDLQRARPVHRLHRPRSRSPRTTSRSPGWRR